jgi:hypothetical protein
MAAPSLEVLGVYRPLVSGSAWRKQWKITADDEVTERHFAGLVLIEAMVNDIEGPFKMGKFGQVHSDLKGFAEHMQVGFDEALLSADGETLIQRKMNCVRGTGPLRFAVYLHFYDPFRSLLWQHGEVQCPPIQKAPARLMRLVPYRACT